MCAAAMLLNAVVRSQVLHQFFYRSLLLGMQLRAALKGVVYLKVSGFFRQYTMLAFLGERNSGSWSHADMYTNQHFSDSLALFY